MREGRKEHEAWKNERGKKTGKIMEGKMERRKKGKKEGRKK